MIAVPYWIHVSDTKLKHPKLPLGVQIAYHLAPRNYISNHQKKNNEAAEHDKIASSCLVDPLDYKNFYPLVPQKLC